MAEIFSRYDEKNIQMHSYDNGTSVVVRKDNWNQLKRVFRRRGFEFDPAELDAIIHCEPGAVVPFINRVYEFLTSRRCVVPAAVDCRRRQRLTVAVGAGRRVPEPPKRVQEELPPYMKPTAAALLHNTMRTAQMVEEHDVTTVEGKVRGAGGVQRELPLTRVSHAS